MSATIQILTARDLLESRECTAPCLLAVNREPDCECCCGGRWHGVLATAEVPGNRPPPWWESHWSQTVLDEMCPVVGTSKGWDGLYRARKKAQQITVGAYRLRRWIVTMETWSAPAGDCSKASIEVGFAFLGTLLDNGRITHGWFDSHSCAYGLRSSTEAQAVGAVFAELFFGNLDAAQAVVAAAARDAIRGRTTA